MMFPAFLVALLLSASCITAVPTRQSTPSVCNGHAEFCSRSYSNVSIIGAHDSYSVGAGNPAANQNYTLLTQLNSGVRMLQVQGHLNNGVLHLCHTLCILLDYGTFTSYLTILNTWLIANPNEVVTLLLVNTDTLPATTWAKSFTDSGVINYVYTPPSVPINYAAWPTLGSLISAGTRVVAFLAQNADVESAPYLIDEFTNIWETNFDETDVSFPCDVSRVTGSPDNKMYLMNHFLDINQTILGTVYPVPDRNSVANTNGLTGVGSLTVQAQLCAAEHGYLPTFTLVDYFDVGNVFQYAATLNSVSYTPVAITNATSGTATSSAGSGTTTSGGGAVVSKPLGSNARTQFISTLSVVIGLLTTIGMAVVFV